MNLSHLSRPSILCQCSRCSSSVAACENEWATLSDTYSTVTAWLSIDMNRINIASEKKQIPQSSELEFVRGRVVQDIVCRLCRQKLGGLVHLEPEAKVFWKLSKMSFREIITMRECDPSFVEGSLSWLLAPVEETVAQNETSNNSPFPANSKFNQALLNQGASLSRISSSVEELHDTMSDLKQSFRALRLELNTTPSARSQDSQGDEATAMLRTVLKELQSKSDEIEKLKLENESLKLKARYLQTRQASDTPRAVEDFAMPTVESPGFLNEYGKRESHDASTRPVIADSFEEDCEITGHTTSKESIQLQILPVKVPLKPAADTPPSPRQPVEHEPSSGAPSASKHRRDSHEPASKRPRLISTAGLESLDNSVDADINPPPKKRGRPSSIRRSLQGTPNAAERQTPSTEVSSMHTTTDSEIQKEDIIDSVSTSGNIKRKGRLRRTRSKAAVSRSTSQATSRPPSVSPRVTRGETKPLEEPQSLQNLTLHNEIPSRQSAFEVAVNVAELTPESVVNEEDLFPNKGNKEQAIQTGEEEEADVANKQREAKVAARDILAKAAMEREEAMADG